MSNNKAERKLRSINRTPNQTDGSQPAKRMRMEGDELYTWARAVQQLEIAQQQVRGMMQAAVQQRGLPYPQYVADDAGYIIPNTQKTPTGDATERPETAREEASSTDSQ
jgi:hypothetical protein